MGPATESRYHREKTYGVKLCNNGGKASAKQTQNLLLESKPGMRGLTFIYGADGETRTRTAFATTPSR
jgi:hypothetical protein